MLVKAELKNPIMGDPMGYPPPPLSRILKDLEAWDRLVPANKGLSPIVPHNKGVRSAGGRQLLVASCQLPGKAKSKMSRTPTLPLELQPLPLELQPLPLL